MNRGNNFSVCQHRPPDHPIPLRERTVAARLWGVWLLVREWKYALRPGSLPLWEQARVRGCLSCRLHCRRHRSNQRMVCYPRMCAGLSSDVSLGFACFLKCPHASAYCWYREETMFCPPPFSSSVGTTMSFQWESLRPQSYSVTVCVN